MGDLEHAVEARLRDKVRRELGGLALKFVSPGFAGVPDRIVLLPGARIVFVETKAPGKKPRKLQRYAAGLISTLGFDVRCIDTKAKVDAFIQEFKAGGNRDALHPTQLPGIRNSKDR